MKSFTFSLFVLFLTTAAFSQGTPRRGSGTPPVSQWHSGKLEQKMPGRPGPPPFDWWRNSDIAQKLNLTDQQKSQLELSFNQQKDQLKDLRDALQKEEAKLQRNFAMMALQFRKILTADQWKQLREQEVMMFHHRERGPVGPPPSDGGNPPRD